MLKEFRKLSLFSQIGFAFAVVIAFTTFIHLFLFYRHKRLEFTREKRFELERILGSGKKVPFGILVMGEHPKPPRGYELLASVEKEGKRYFWFVKKGFVGKNVLREVSPYAILMIFIFLTCTFLYLIILKKLFSPIYGIIEEAKRSKGSLSMDFSRFYNVDRVCSQVIGCGREDCPFYDKGCIQGTFDERPCMYSIGSGCRYIKEVLGENEISLLAFFLDSAVKTLGKRNRELEELVKHREILKGKYEAIFEGAADAIFVVDPETGRIVECNKAAEELTGYSKEELLTMRYLDLRTKSERIRAMARFKSLKEEGEGEFLDIPILRKDGGIKYVDIRARLVKLGEKPFVVSIMRDTTKRKEAHLELVRAEKFVSLGQMASGITHEINNPLAVISMALEMVKEKGNDFLKNIVDKALLSVEKIKKLIATLHEFANPRSTSFYPLDLNDVVKKVARLSGYEVRRGGVELRLKLSEEIPRILGVEEQLFTLISELVLNATHAVREVNKKERFVEIETFYDEDKGKVCLVVRDNGVGMTEEEMKKIFEPFYTTKEDSTGLGLLVVQKIVHDHKGVIEVRSKKGEGTEFRICFDPFQH